MKRLLPILLVAAILCGNPVFARAESAVPQVSAASAVMMDGDTGRVLYEKDSRTRRPIASITKLMTALVALESGHSLDETVTVAREWTGAEGSSLYLRPGEEVTLEELLYGLMLRSGNDAALAIAGYCGGSVEAFVAQMNQRARALGMEDTSFANPNGLTAEGHCSTAYDMALLARSCLENEALARIVSTKSIALGTRVFTNHNKLLWRYEGCIGLKTGYTDQSGRTLVSAARRGGVTLICVTLNAPGDWADHAGLFDYGFANYEARPLSRAGERVGQLPVSGALVPVCPIVTAEDRTAAMTPDEAAEAVYRLTESALEAPVRAGTRVGETIYYCNGQELARVPLAAGGSAPDIFAPKGGFHLWRNVFKN